MGKVLVIGNRVDAIQQTYVNNEKQARTVWHPMIEGDGRMHTFKDEATASGLVERVTKQEAIEAAKSIRDRIQAKDAEK